MPRFGRGYSQSCGQTWLMPDVNGLQICEKTPAIRDEREKSTFLSDKDDSGRWVDFHALRHTFITGRGLLAALIQRWPKRWPDVR